MSALSVYGTVLTTVVNCGNVSIKNLPTEAADYVAELLPEFCAHW